MRQEKSAREIAEQCVGQTGGVITALRRIVAACGHIQPPHIEAVAELFNLSLAEVRGIISFYSDLRTEPAGRRRIRICQAEACQALGARELTAAAIAKLGVGLGETAADGSLSLEAVYCLGLCASGPSAMLDDRVIVRATLEALAP